MAINDPIPPQPTELTPLDRAVILYHTMGEDFISILDQYISSFPHSKRYTFFGPGYILLGHEETRENPHVEDSPAISPYWYVTYASGNLPKLIQLMPYELDRVGFARYAKYPERGICFVLTKTLNRLYHGIQTKSTSAPTSSSASTPSSGTNS
jgi:hypothetical protein